MTDKSSDQTRRTMLAGTAAVGISLTALSGLNIAEARPPMPNESIRASTASGRFPTFGPGRRNTKIADWS
jgi:hypothetical protein